MMKLFYSLLHQVHILDENFNSKMSKLSSTGKHFFFSGISMVSLLTIAMLFPNIINAQLVNDLVVTWPEIDQLEVNEEGKVQLDLFLETKNTFEEGKVIILNNTDDGGEKADPVDLRSLGKKDKRKRITKSVELKTGKNEIRVGIKSANELVSSNKIVLTYRDGKVSVDNVSTTNEEGIYWDRPTYSPNPINQYTSAVKIKATIVSFEQLVDKKQIYLEVGGLIKYRPKAKDVSLKSVGKNHYEYSCTYYFQTPGTEKIEIIVKRSTIKPIVLRSESMIFDYQRTKSNLHILAIGVEHPDLRYTVKDARDITKRFASQQELGIYDKVNVDTLLGQAATASKMRIQLETYATQAKEENRFGLNDLLVVYLSSHGFNRDGDLRIKGADFSNYAQVETSVSFDKELVPMLASIPCNKLLLIDACQSGEEGARNDNHNLDEVEKYLEKLEAITVITSSQAKQSSYEHKEWQNGAFTKVILEALDPERAYQLDIDGSNSITPNELERHLIKKVSTLVDKKFKKVQVPDYRTNKIGTEPVFYIK